MTALYKHLIVIVL